MCTVIEITGGVYSLIYPTDHVFVLSSKIDNKVKSRIQSTRLKLVNVSKLNVGYKQSIEDIVLSSNKANLLRLTVIDSKTYNKKYYIVATVETLNGLFEHYVKQKNTSQSQTILNQLIFGLSITSNILSSDVCYQTIKQYRLPFYSINEVCNLFTYTIFDKIYKFKRSYTNCVGVRFDERYTFKLADEDLVSPLKSCMEIDNLMWFIDKQYIKSGKFTQELKTVLNSKNYNQTVLANAFVDCKFETNQLIPVVVSNESSFNTVKCIDRYRRTAKRQHERKHCNISSILIDSCFKYCIVKFADGYDVKIGQHLNNEPHTVNFGFLFNGIPLNRNPINRKYIDKLFTVVDGIYQLQSYNNRIRACADILQSISKHTKCHIFVDGTNNTQDLTELYSGLNEYEKIYGYNVLNTLHNFVSYLVNEDISLDVKINYLYKCGEHNISKPNILVYSVD